MAEFCYMVKMSIFIDYSNIVSNVTLLKNGIRFDADIYRKGFE